MGRLDDAYYGNTLQGYGADFALFEDQYRKSGLRPPASPEAVAWFIAHTK